MIDAKTVLRTEGIRLVVSEHKRWLDGDGGERAILVGKEIDRVSYGNLLNKGSPVFRKSVYKECVFKRCRFDHASIDKIRFEKCIFENCGFDCASAIGTVFGQCQFSICHFSGKLSSADFSNSTFKHTNFNNGYLDGANMSGAKFFDCEFGERVSCKNANFTGAVGLWGERPAVTDGIIYGEWAVYRRQFDFISWSQLRSIGSFRLFGVSYIAMVSLLVFFNIREIYNQYIADNPSGILWLDPAPPIGGAPYLVATLAAVFMLAAGATIFEIFCPNLIKEASEIRWTRELGRPVTEYRSASWTYGSMGPRNIMLIRYVCMALYVIGGGWTFGYLAYRVWDTLVSAI